MRFSVSGSWLAAGLWILAAGDSSAQTCETVGGGDKVVCAVLGTACNPPSNGNCQTTIYPCGVTKCSRCDCLVGNAPFPNDSTFRLNSTGVIPSAHGHATVRWVEGERWVALGLSGLQPLASYQVYAHVGSSNCAGGTLVAVGAPFATDDQGNAALLDPAPALSPLSVQETAGARFVLCGTPPQNVGVPAPEMENMSLAVWPNPVRREMVAAFTPPALARWRALLLDLGGRRIVTLGSGVGHGATSTMRWSTTGVPPGIYLLRIETDRGSASRRVVLLGD